MSWFLSATTPAAQFSRRTVITTRLLNVAKQRCFIDNCPLRLPVTQDLQGKDLTQ